MATNNAINNTLPNGTLVQVVNFTASAVATGSTVIPNDNTIPQNTEGDQYMTLAITPKSTTNTLVITVVAQASHSVVRYMTCALFQDSTANAIAAVSNLVALGTAPNQLVLQHTMAAGTTSATTFKIRIGGDSTGTTTFNGAGGTQLFGGITKSSIVIWEYKS